MTIYRDMSFYVPPDGLPGQRPTDAEAIETALAMADGQGWRAIAAPPRVNDLAWTAGVEVVFDCEPAHSGKMPGCPSCRATPVPHYPSTDCESGRRIHCTCSACFD